MISTNQVFRDGGTNNRSSNFIGEYYDFWKIRMQAYLEAQKAEHEKLLKITHVFLRRSLRM